MTRPPVIILPGGRSPSRPPAAVPVTPEKTPSEKTGQEPAKPTAIQPNPRQAPPAKQRRGTPWTPHPREFLLPDGRRILAERQAVVWIGEGKPENFEGKTVTLLALKFAKSACPVLASYSDVAAWWTGTAFKENGKTREPSDETKDTL